MNRVISTRTITKYRVEEHYQNCNTYCFYGAYKTLNGAKKKKTKMIQKGINAEHLYIIKTTTTTLEICE